MISTPLDHTLSPAHPPTVLVVDDHAHVRTLVCRWLSEAGYRCLSAESVAAANEILASEPIEVITSDITMPGKSGTEWLPQLCADYPQVGVLMLSACEDTRLAMAAITAGAWGYMIKPVAKEELLFQVGRTLERRRFLQAEQMQRQLLEEKVRQQTRLLRESHEETIERLISASMVRDDETGEHIRRIGVLSALVADTMGWSTAEVDTIRLAAPMHDIGKVGIPDAILQKPGPLVPKEFEVMKTHTIIGAQILAGSKLPMLQMAAEIARSHHERWDGEGYPDRRRRDEIPLPARIVAVVDVYDALTHDRVYRPALPESVALETIRNGSSAHFDPDLVNIFFDALPVIRDALAVESTLVGKARRHQKCDEPSVAVP